MDRRDFLKKSALAIAGAVVGGGLASSLVGSSGCTPAPKGKRIGLQLYSLREAMKENPAETLRKIAQMGYKDLETASYHDGKVYGYAPEEFRTLVEGMGMKVASCHIGRGWDADREAEIMAWWERAIADHKVMGCRYIIVPWVALGSTDAEIETLCTYLSRIGAMVSAAGMTFGYHNHSGEFATTAEGNIIYDYMLAHTDPTVSFEMDVYWVTQGGHNPVDYLNRYAGRFPALHIKDDSIIGESGKIDFEPIFEAAYKQGMKDFFIEVEQYTMPPEICVQRSFDFLEVAPYVK